MPPGFDRRGLRSVGLLLALPFALPAAAAEVRVVDDAGAPLADATVLCWRGAKFADMTGPDGVVEVPDTCTEVRCEMARGGRPPAQEPVRAGRAVCRLRPGATVVVVPGPADAARRLQVLAFADDGSVGGSGRFFPRPESEGEREERIGPLPPGRYTLDASVPEEPDWSCSRELGALPPGETRVDLTYRAPQRVTGRVLTASGRPAAGELVRARSARPAAGGDPAAAWRCSPARWSREPLTAADGSFTLLVDPGGWPVTIEVGHPRDEEGTTTVVLDAPPPGPLTIARRPAPYETGYGGPPPPR